MAKLAALLHTFLPVKQVCEGTAPRKMYIYGLRRGGSDIFLAMKILLTLNVFQRICAQFREWSYIKKIKGCYTVALTAFITVFATLFVQCTRFFVSRCQVHCKLV